MPRHFVYVGTKGDGRTEPGPAEPSIPVLVLDDDTGRLERLHYDVGHLPAPSWLCVPPTRPTRFMYAACRAETLGEEPTGVGSDNPADHFAVAFEVNAADGTLRELNRQPTVGIGPTHCGASDSMLVTAQYMGGGATAFSCAADGSLLPTRAVIHHEYSSNANPVRQYHSFCHGAVIDPAGKRVLIPDLGADRVYVYDLHSATGTLTPAPVPFFSSSAGSGPRSFCFHPNSKFCYLITEIDSTIVPLAYDAGTGKLTQTGPVVETLPEDWPGLDPTAGGVAPTGEAPKGKKGNLTAHLEVSPDGRFVYGSNRGHDSIVTFRVAPESGALKLVSHTHGGGKSPRAFAIHPSGKWLLVANEASGNVVVFARDVETGLLTQTAAEQGEIPTCMCLVFVSQEERSLAVAAAAL